MIGPEIFLSLTVGRGFCGVEVKPIQLVLRVAASRVFQVKEHTSFTTLNFSRGNLGKSEAKMERDNGFCG